MANNNSSIGLVSDFSKRRRIHLACRNSVRPYHHASAIPRPSVVRTRRQFKGFAISHPSEFAIVERKPKGIAEGRERSLGRVGLGGFERELMGFSWGRALAFATAAAFPGDGQSRPSRRCGPLPCRRQQSGGSPRPTKHSAWRACVDPRRHSQRCDWPRRSRASLRHRRGWCRAPAASDVLGIELGLEALQLCFGERHHFVLTARAGLGLPSWAPGISPPRFRSASRA